MRKMMFHVVVSAKAKLELQEILDYLAAEASARLAIQMTDKLLAAVDELGDNALMHALVPQHEESGIRRRVVGSYNIYYVARGDAVSVLHVLHHARDQGRLLFPED